MRNLTLEEQVLSFENIGGEPPAVCETCEGLDIRFAHVEIRGKPLDCVIWYAHCRACRTPVFVYRPLVFMEPVDDLVFPKPQERTSI